MAKRLEGKKAVITGGTTGLGLAMAKRYIEEGAKVLITGRSQKNIDKALSELGKNAEGIVSDASVVKDLETLANKAKKSFGQVDILIANAGSGIFAPISEIDEKGFDKQFDINVKGVFFTVQKIIPLMKKGGSIILVSSAVNAKALNTGSIYSATKAAVRSFARNFAAELGPQGIRVNSLSPGIVPTEFFKNSNLRDDSFGQFEKLVVSQLPLGRAGTPLEIANAALYLGSDESSYMTANDVVVDGGWMNV